VTKAWFPATLAVWKAPVVVGKLVESCPLLKAYPVT
jgi:hypothetical protein